MFDFGFSELMIIGAVGLVVLGPEKLPIVAKTAGEWIGKAQRMVQQVKNDIEREAELSELRQIQTEAKKAVDDLQNVVKSEADGIEKDLKTVTDDVNATAKEASAHLNEIETAAKDVANDFGKDGVTPQTDSYKDFKDSLNSGTASTGSDPSDDFYSWYNGETEDDESQAIASDDTVTFDRRYRPGPTVDDLTEQVEKIKTEIGDRSARLGGNNHRWAVRARTNRVRIYR